MLCIDVGDIPSDLTGHIALNDALVFSNAHLTHRTATSTLPQQITDMWKKQGWHVEHIRSVAPLLGTHGVPQTHIDSDAHAVNELIRRCQTFEKYNGLYLKLHGCADVRRFTTGAQTGADKLRFEPSAHDADALQHGRVGLRVDDETLASRSLFSTVDDLRLSANRRAHLCTHGVGEWPERELRKDVVARANGIRQLALIGLARLEALVKTIRTHVPPGTSILVFATGTVTVGSHNGTNEDPWDSRSLCVLCGHGAVKSTVVKSHVNLDETVISLVRAILTRTSIDNERVRLQRGRVVVTGNGWVKSYVHANLQWYCIIHTDAPNCWVYNLTRDPDMLHALNSAPREVVTHGQPLALDTIQPSVWIRLPAITTSETLTIIVARHCDPIVLQGHWKYHMLAQLAGQRMVLTDLKKGVAVTLQGAVQVGTLRLLGRRYEAEFENWLVHPAA